MQYRINLTDSGSDFVEFTDSSVPNIYGVAFRENGEVFQEMYFASVEDRDAWYDMMNVEPIDSEWICDCGFIAEDENGDAEIVNADIQMDYVEA